MNENQNHSNEAEEKPSTFVQILNGFGISVVAYVLVIGLAFLFQSMLGTAIVAFIVLTLYGFLAVKSFRKGYTAMAITMLALIAPQIFFLLLFGACAVTMMSY